MGKKVGVMVVDDSPICRQLIVDALSKDPELEIVATCADGKEATQKVLNRLRRLGVIDSYGEDTPGSFIVSLAPLRTLLEAPARRRTPAPAPTRRLPPIEGLRPATRDRLRYLASRALDALGVKEPGDALLEGEMARQFSMIIRTAPAGIDGDKWLDGAITKALREYAETD
jgi:CheY-like chemotaxis protein